MLDPFKKTEQLLYNYNSFINAINEKVKYIEFLKAQGIPEKSKSIVGFGGDVSYLDHKLEEERIGEEIARIALSIDKTERSLEKIEQALTVISDDKYYDIIRLKYFDGKNNAQIALEMGCDVKTVTRNRNRLVKRIAIHLFPDEMIEEFLKCP